MEGGSVGLEGIAIDTELTFVNWAWARSDLTLGPDVSRPLEERHLVFRGTAAQKLRNALVSKREAVVRTDAAAGSSFLGQ